MPVMKPLMSVVPLSEGAVCVRLVGELDLAAAPALRVQLVTAVASARDVVVSTAGVTFLDCACVGALNAARLQAAERGGRLCLADLTRPVVRLLALTNLAEHFETYPDPESAMAPSVRSGSSGLPSRSPS
jgi:anti-sigma B factor antagonist